MSQECQSIPKYADRGKGADSRWEAVEQSIRMINQISAVFPPSPCCSINTYNCCPHLGVGPGHWTPLGFCACVINIY